MSPANVLGMVGVVALMLLFVFGYSRYFERSTARAHNRWNQALQAMVQRYGLTFYRSKGPYDWAGAGGMFHGHHIGFSLISETVGPMRTGVFVQFQRPLAPELLASLKERRRSIHRGRKLEVRTFDRFPGTPPTLDRSVEVRTSARVPGTPLPIEVDELVATLLEGAYDAEITPLRIVVTLETREHDFFEYDMLTDTDRLIATVEKALDLAITLEAANG